MPKKKKHIMIELEVDHLGRPLQHSIHQTGFSSPGEIIQALQYIIEKIKHGTAQQ